MASIVKRGKTYSIVYYEGEGKDRHQVWESGLSYNAAKARKAQLKYEVAQYPDKNGGRLLPLPSLYCRTCH